MNAKRRWGDIFRDKFPEHVLKLGYYCVKLPTDKERSEHTREAMEAIAMELLQSTTPWSELSSIGRVGVRALIANISTLLMQIIEDSCVLVDWVYLMSPNSDRDLQVAQADEECPRPPCGLRSSPRWAAGAARRGSSNRDSSPYHSVLQRHAGNHRRYG